MVRLLVQSVPSPQFGSVPVVTPIAAVILIGPPPGASQSRLVVTVHALVNQVTVIIEIILFAVGGIIFSHPSVSGDGGGGIGMDAIRKSLSLDTKHVNLHRACARCPLLGEPPGVTSWVIAFLKIVSHALTMPVARTRAHSDGRSTWAPSQRAPSEERTDWGIGTIQQFGYSDVSARRSGHDVRLEA